MTGAGGTTKVPSLPPPRPKSPPQYPDLYGKRRELARVQLLEREIGFLEGIYFVMHDVEPRKVAQCHVLEFGPCDQIGYDIGKQINKGAGPLDELKFVEGLQPASRSCKEIADHVVANPDPFIPTTKRVHKSCGFWKWLCGTSCFSFSSCFCCRGCCAGCCKGCRVCTPHLEMPNCCKSECNKCQCTSCIQCPKPRCSCCSSQDSQCCKMPSCSLTCCIPKCPSCPSCHCKGCISCYPKCLKINLCSCCCTKNCCCCCCRGCYICY